MMMIMMMMIRMITTTIRIKKSAIAIKACTMNKWGENGLIENYNKAHVQTY